MLLDQAYPSAASFAVRAKTSLAAHELSALSAYRSMRRSLVRELFGTHEPSFHLHSFQGAVTSVTGVLNTVLSIGFQSCVDYSALAAVFDEFKFVGPFEVKYYPATTPGNAATGKLATAVAVLDYGEGGALASTNLALAYDTARVFALEAFDFRSRDSWSGHVQGQPDKQWESADTNLIVCYWKVYNYANVTGSVTFGNCQFYIDIQFRQID